MTATVTVTVTGGCEQTLTCLPCTKTLVMDGARLSTTLLKRLAARRTTDLGAEKRAGQRVTVQPTSEGAVTGGTWEPHGWASRGRGAGALSPRQWPSQPKRHLQEPPPGARGRPAASPLPPASSAPTVDLKRKKRKANCPFVGSGEGGGTEYSDFASKDALLSLSLAGVICSYDHFKSCFFWCLDDQTPGLGAQSGLDVRK